jgi:VWFA-related protein
VKYIGCMATALWAMVIVAILLFGDVFAQAPSNDPMLHKDLPVEGIDTLDPLLTIRKQVDEVRLFFTVTDSRGRFVTALNQHDFTLLDNGLPPERFYQFEGRTALPLHIILLVDVSSSVRYRFPFEQKAAVMLLRNTLRPGIDRASVVAFGSTVTKVQPLTSEIHSVEKAIHGLRPGGDTSLFDALLLASHEFDSSALDGTRKVIVLLTDGADTASHGTESESIDALEHSEATVLVVDSTVPSESGTKGQAFLDRLTTHSGGIILPARQPAELKNAFRAVEKVLRNQYALSYKPAGFQSNGVYRTIQLTAMKRGWRVRCRSGYYAKIR